MTQARVLIVDDNALNVELMGFVLGVSAFEVASAYDADNALQQIPLFLPDVILMDIQMPGMDGLELTRRLKADPNTRHIVVVACTAHAMKGDEARMRTAGCDGYIAKPIDVVGFAAEILSYCVRGRAERERAADN